MSRNTGIVSSVPRYRGKPLSIRLMDSSRSSNMERKGLFMFSNRSSVISRGGCIAAMALAVAAVAGLAGTASASIIYQDNFSGSSSNPLNATSPSVDATGATWTADTGWRADGSQTAADAATNGSSDAYLPFTPSSGNIYTLSATMSPSLTSGSNWFALGFVGSFSSATSTTGGAVNNGDGVNAWFADSGSGQLNAGPWLLMNSGWNGEDPNESYFPGPGASGAVDFTGKSGDTVAIVLNTQSSAWTFQVFVNGTNVSPVIPFSSNPAITGVGLGQFAPAVGSVSNFSLTSVPEPATLGLCAVGGLGLLLLKRRRVV